MPELPYPDQAVQGRLGRQATQRGQGGAVCQVRQLRACQEVIPEGSSRLPRQADWLGEKACKSGQEQGSTAGKSNIVDQAGRAC